MTLDPDVLLDRRRLKRRLAVWRIVAIVALVAVALVGVGRFDGMLVRDHVARFVIEGVILEDFDAIDALAEVADDSRVKALIVYIDSPGGTFVGGEMLFDALRNVAESKPVVAVMGTVATSAGYMAAGRRGSHRRASGHDHRLDRGDYANHRYYGPSREDWRVGRGHQERALEGNPVAA